jgi:hypothetical protein
MAAGQVTYKFVDDVPAAPSSYKFVDEPKAEPSKTLPANAGLANFVANIAGLPADTMQSGINLVRAAQGGMAGLAQKAGVPGATDWMPPLLKGSPGTSEWIKAQLRGTEQPGLSPDNPSNSPMGRAQFDLMSRGGFLPGGALPAVGSVVAERTLGPEWAGVGAMAPQAAITGYNALRAPSLARQEAENSVRDSTLRAAQDEGYVVPPSSSGGGFLSRRLESIGGKAAVGQQAAAQNQKITNAIARRELGLSKMSPLSEDTLNSLRNKLAAPYREVARIDQEAASALEKLKQTRFDANAQHKFYNHTPNPEVLAKAKALDAEAARLESYLEGIAANAGKASLVDELRKARTQIAKTYDVERALNIGTGDVAAKSLGRALDKGKPLSGGLATAGRFAEAFPSYAREGATIPTPGVSKSEMILGLGLGLGGYGVGGVPGIAMAALPLMSGPVRSGILSKPYQKLVAPNYSPALTPASSPQLLYQLGILNQQN